MKLRKERRTMEGGGGGVVGVDVEEERVSVSLTSLHM